MKKILLFIVFISFGLICIIWYHIIKQKKDSTIDISYKQSLLNYTLSCDEYTINSIKSLWYTGNVEQQWTGCVIVWTEHKFTVSSLDVVIVFDNQYSSYFLDKSKKPVVLLSGNEIITTKEDSLSVVKNNDLSLQDFISWYFSWCEEQTIQSWGLESQIICKKNDISYWYYVQKSEDRFYIVKTQPTAKMEWRYEIL